MAVNKQIRQPFILIFLILLAFAFSGCSSGTRDAIFDSDAGGHPAGWVSTHPKTAVFAANECTPCHSDDLSGGISGVSCLTSECHHDPVQNWPSPAQHGASAKKAPGNSGFASCQICHGTDFTGGLSGQDCFLCHPGSPHPNNWLPSNNTLVHIDTSEENAPVCFQCHAGGTLSPLPAPPPPEPGAQPGCFNNTLCHGTDVSHPEGWANPDAHGTAAKGTPGTGSGLSYCQICHGTDFAGGTVNVSCFTCHGASSPHPSSWLSTSERKHITADQGNASVCFQCHAGGALSPLPPPPAPTPGAQPGCFNNTLCHGPGQATHSIPFLGHPQEALNTFETNCADCHAESGTSPFSTAPTCDTCHQSGSPLTLGSCTSCHAEPPDGSLYPNIGGKHSLHNSIDGVSGICATCHDNLGSGTINHYNRANARPGKNALRVPPGDLSFFSTYNANAGSASFNDTALTCSNVSCHGGITTPSWQTGTIDVSNDCEKCHTPGTSLGQPEDNSPYSGLHLFHLGSEVSATCTECHDMANGSTGADNHFAFLDTPQMEGPAAGTFANSTGSVLYDTSDQTCTGNCHGQDHDGFPWSGDANHAVPFQATAHTQVSQTGFNSSCSACHDLSPSDPSSTPPNCTTCHQEGSPLTLGSCTSCHGEPPNGSTYPNIAGRHNVHDSLSGVTDLCTTCHSGLDFGTPGHYDRANARAGKDGQRTPPGDVNVMATYDGKGGSSSFNSTGLTCTNVSCHGGITTPNWQTGTIDVSNDCEACHTLGSSQGIPENNSPFSGRHQKHLQGLGGNGNATCTECHNMAKNSAVIANHFASLATPQMEGPPSQTFENSTGTIVYNPADQTCTGTCHTQQHSSFPWEGSVATHAVPFLDARHTTVTQEEFESDCDACHNLSPSDPSSIPPNCTTCHQSGSPLTLTGCTSCHAEPPDGSSYPNISGRHGTHDDLTGVTGNCATCHTGLESGSLAHYQRANARQGSDGLRVQPGDANIASSYDARSGGAFFNAGSLTCSDVSCHGGQTTPNWRTGVLNVNSDCLSCHERGNNQFNSYNSGEHGKHENEIPDEFPGIAPFCVACHNTANLAAHHFTNLNTQAMEGPASGTIGGGSTLVNSYDPGSGSCLPSCHEQESWND